MQKPVVPPSAATAIQVANVFNNQPRIAVIGLRTTTKLPAGKWKDVIEGNLFTDVELKGLWHEYNGRLNIGIATGRPSGIVVVDADNQAGMEWVEQNLPSTPMRVKTKKGCHYYYRLDDEVDQRNRTDILGSKKKWEHDAQEKGFDVRSHHYSDPDAQKTENERVQQAMKAAWAAGIHVGAIIDVRGTGGQVVGPFSKKDDGYEYTWVEPWTPELFERVPFWNPEWVSEELKWKRPSRGVVSIAKLGAKTTDEDREKRISSFTESEKYRRAKGWLSRTPGAVEGQRGHDHTFYVACRLCNGFDIGPEATLELMLQWNSSCQPPWTEQELVHKVGDAMKLSGPGNGGMLEDRPEFLAAQKVKIQTQMADDDALSIYDDAVDETPPAQAGAGGGGAGAPPPAPPGGGGPPPGNKPNPAPSTGGGPAMNADVRKSIAKAWAYKGVNLKDLEAASCPYNYVTKERGNIELPVDMVNVVAALRFSSEFKGATFRFNNLTDKPEVDGVELTDDVENEFRYKLTAKWGRDVNANVVSASLKYLCFRDRYEPGEEWLNALPAWDGKDRYADVVGDVLGCDRNAPAFTWWVRQLRSYIQASVARMYRPGVKAEQVLFLQGEQGAFKSTFFKVLSPKPEWFTDTPLDMRNRDSLMVVVKHYFIEWSEGEHAKSPQRIDEVKQFVSRQVEDYRSPYEHHSRARPRRCVFCATSNDRELLHDPTGSRRFHVIAVPGEIDFAALRAMKEQLWAQARDEVRAHWAAEEAAEQAHAGDPKAAVMAAAADPAWQAGRWWLTKTEEHERAKHQADFKARSVHDDFVGGWVESRKPGEPFALWDLMTAMEIPQERRSKRLHAELTQAMTDAGAVPTGRQETLVREIGSRKITIRARTYVLKKDETDQSF